MTPQQLKFWQPYIDLVGAENFQYISGKGGGPNLIRSKHYCGFDVSGMGIGGESMRNIAINRYRSYQKLLAKGTLSFEEVDDIVTSDIEKPYLDSELLILLNKHCRDITTDQYWKLVIKCWCRQELTTAGERATNWKALFTQRERPKYLTQELPATFTAYRAGQETGFSWTLSEKVATWFQSRFEMEFGEVPLLSRDFSADDAVFYTNQRNEQEVVILPIER